MNRRRAQGAGKGALAVGLAVLVAGTACASESDSSLVVEGSWERVEQWEQPESFDFDQVAAGNSAGAVAWLNRSAGNPDQLAYWEIRDGGDATELELPAPVGPVLIPVAVGVDADGWGAVAVTRDEARGANTGLLAWHGTSDADADASADVEAGQPLTPPGDVTAPPESVSVGRSADLLVVAALYEGEPVLWWRSGGGDAWRSGADGADLGLDVPADLVNLRVVGDGTRLVLAAVADDGTPHLWTSDDGGEWAAVGSDDLPETAGSVGLLAPLDSGSVAIGWLSDEDSAPWDATAATIQRLTGDDLTDEGRIEAETDDEVERLHLTSATLSPDDRLVVVGGAVRPDSDRTPMAWVAAGRSGADGWEPTTQEELTGHLDHEFRAIVSTDDRMVAVASALSQTDVESWHWRPD